MSYHGDSDQEAAHNIEQFVDNAKAANRSLIACTEYSHLVQFMEALEGGPSTLEDFWAHMQREVDQGCYPFTLLPPGSHEEVMDPQDELLINHIKSHKVYISNLDFNTEQTNETNAMHQ